MPHEYNKKIMKDFTRLLNESGAKVYLVIGMTESGHSELLATDYLTPEEMKEYLQGVVDKMDFKKVHEIPDN